MKAFASDLDNTLIYSYKKDIGKNKVLVEKYKEKEVSYMTNQSYSLLNRIHNKMLFVPISTRSIEQYKRIKLSEQWHPKLALVSNGGILLENGKIDVKWQIESLNLIAQSLEEQEKAIHILKKDSYRTFDIRKVDDLFVFTKSSNAEATIKCLSNELNQNIVSIFNNGCKIYILPKNLDKGTALKRFKTKYGITHLIAAGDSLFDLPMLNIADVMYFPEALKLNLCNSSCKINIIPERELLSDKMLQDIIEKNHL